MFHALLLVFSVSAVLYYALTVKIESEILFLKVQKKLESGLSEERGRDRSLRSCGTRQAFENHPRYLLKNFLSSPMLC